MNTAMSLMDEPVYEDYEFMISLYFVQNRYEEARDLALEAIEEYPNESAFIQFLADSYLETGETERAISLIRDLIEDNPNNPQYYFVLGTQLYRTAEEHINESGRLYQRIYQMQDQMAQLSSSERENLESEIESLRLKLKKLKEKDLNLQIWLWKKFNLLLNSHRRMTMLTTYWVLFTRIKPLPCSINVIIPVIMIWPGSMMKKQENI
jgi:tetratricopeptide (TPR) repeat protein